MAHLHIKPEAVNLAVAQVRVVALSGVEPRAVVRVRVVKAVRVVKVKTAIKPRKFIMDSLLL
jgi:hypothetical protein